MILFTFPVSVPLLLIYFVWRKKNWTVPLKLFLTIILLPFPIAFLSGLSSGSQSTSTLNSNPTFQPVAAQIQLPKPSFDIPALLGKKFNEVTAVIGKPKESKPPTKQELTALNNEWDVEFDKDNNVLDVKYDYKTGKVIDFFLYTFDSVGETSKDYMLAIGNLKADAKEYRLKFVEAINKPGHYTGVTITPIDFKALQELIAKRKQFDPNLGNNANAASTANGYIQAAKASGVGLAAYLELTAPDDALQAYMGGGEDNDYQVKVSRADLTIVINNYTWSVSPDSTKKDLVTSFVTRLKQYYPNAFPAVTVSNGIRTVATGSWSVWDGEPKVELK